MLRNFLRRAARVLAQYAWPLAIASLALSLSPSTASALLGSTTTVASSANPSAFGQSVTFTATVTGVIVTPTGTVTFKDGATTLGTGTLNGSGQATYSTSILLPGDHTITAVYGGDANYGASTSAPLTQTVNIASTTTAVASSVNPSGFGQSVTFTATVTGLILPPTGTVTFKDGATTLGTGTLNGSGQATFSTTTLAAGSHSITAVYGGDTIYASSTSPILTQNVNSNSSTTTIVSSVNPSALTQSVTFTVTVTGSGGTPTGTVTFKDGSTTLGTRTLDGSGQAAYTTSTLLPGDRIITAVYGGDSNYGASTSAPLTQTVTILPSSTTLVSSLNPSAYGQSVTFTATVTGTVLTPTGTVTFKDGATTLGTGTLDGSGQATFSTSTLAGGSHSITAVYGGDVFYGGSTSSPLTQTVNQSSDTTSLASSVNPSTFGQSVTFTATVSGAGATGTVTFKDGATTLGTGTLNGGAQATFSTSALALGSHSITAEYAGDTNYTGSTSAPLTQTVNQASTSTTVASSVNPSAQGQLVTLTATVASSGGTATGTVTFKDGATTLGTGSLDGGGQATFATAALALGAHSITAEYGGDSNFTASTSPALAQNVVASGSTTTIASSPNPSSFGQPVTFTATVTGSGGTPTGTVTFKDGTTALGTMALSGNQAILVVSTLSGGSHSMTAVYNGDGSYGSSTSAPLTQIVNQNTSNVTLASSVNPSAVGQSVTFAATVTGSGGIATGTVTFKDGATTLGTGTLNGGGQATFATSSLTAGSHPITAAYGGDSNFTAGTSAPLTQTVGGTSSATTLTSSVNPSAFGQPVTFTATVTGSGGTPTGTVTFKDGATALGTGALNGASQATFATSSLTAGSHSIRATYGGNGQFAGSDSNILIQTVAAPTDSAKLRSLQIAMTKIEAQNSGQAISGAVSSAIAEGFSDSGEVITPTSNGIRINFAAEPRRAKALEAIASAADKGTSHRVPPGWLPWLDLRGTGWTSPRSKGDIGGGQVNALIGITRRVTPDLLVGFLGGYETFNYTAENPVGRLRGDGWTMGAYLGWRLLPGLRFDAAGARSGLNYNGDAGAATGSFPGDRRLVSAGLTGIYKATTNVELEPSARLFALWEHEKAYVDSLGTAQAERSFFTGRGSVGVKATYRIAWWDTVALAPYFGVYADHYFTKDDAQATALTPEFFRGLSARATAGVAVSDKSGANLSLGGELGGIGTGNFNVWSVRGRALVPF
jgi:Bacterial Ig-like domain (group 3)